MDYEYFSKHYKLIAIDLSKQIELENSDLKQQINFIETLENDRATIFFQHWKWWNQKKQLLNFHKILWVSNKMETQQTINLLNYSSNEGSKFVTKKWYV